MSDEVEFPVVLLVFELFLDLGESSLPAPLQSRFRFVGGAECSAASVESCDFSTEFLSTVQSDLKLVGSTSGTHTRSLPARGNTESHMCVPIQSYLS